MSSSSPVCCFSEAYVCFCGKVPVPEVVESELFSDEEEAEEELLEADAVEAWSHHLVSFLLLSFSVRGVCVCVRFHTGYSVLLYHPLSTFAHTYLYLQYVYRDWDRLSIACQSPLRYYYLVLLWNPADYIVVHISIFWICTVYTTMIYLSTLWICVYHSHNINCKLDLDHIDVVFDSIDMCSLIFR